MNFAKRFLLASVLLGALAPVVAVAQFQPPSKEELEMTSDPKAPGAPAVYLYREEREDDPHHFRSVYARIKILTEQGKEAATVHVTYQKNFIFYAGGDNSSRSSSGMESHFDAPDINHAGEDPRIDTNAFGGHIDVSAIEGRTIHPDGTVVPLTGSPADLLKSKVGANQINELTFTLPSVEVGSILEYRYQVRYDRFQEAPEWQIQQPYFVHKAHYVFTPADQFNPHRNLAGQAGGVSTSALIGSHGEEMTDIRSNGVLPPGKEVMQNAVGDYYVDFTDIPAIPHEVYAPPLASQIYKVNFFYTFTPDPKEFWQKEMQYWIKDVNQFTAPTSQIRSTANEVTSGLTDPLDKAKKLYALVQKFENVDFSAGMRSSSSTDRIPSGSVDQVLERKKGNSEQIALLYLALVRAVGIEARPERITSRIARTFSAPLLDTTQLDCALIGVNIDGKETVLDPGEKFAPFGTLHWSHAGAGGVAMGSNGKVETILTPLQLNTDNKEVRVGEITVSPQGSISGTLKVGFTGQEAMFLRQLSLRSDADAVRQQMERIISSEVPSGVQAHIERVAALDDPEKQLVAVITVSGSLSDHAGNHLVLPRLFFETRETDPFPNEASRTLPIDMSYPSVEQEQITYNFPPGYSLEAAPQDTSFKWEENAAYTVRSKVAANSITTGRVFARGFTLLEASDYAKLREFYDKVGLADRQQLVLTTRQSSN